MPTNHNYDGCGSAETFCDHFICTIAPLTPIDLTGDGDPCKRHRFHIDSVPPEVHAFDLRWLI